MFEKIDISFLHLTKIYNYLKKIHIIYKKLLDNITFKYQYMKFYIR